MVFSVLGHKVRQCSLSPFFTLNNHKSHIPQTMCPSFYVPHMAQFWFCASSGRERICDLCEKRRKGTLWRKNVGRNCLHQPIIKIKVGKPIEVGNWSLSCRGKHTPNIHTFFLKFNVKFNDSHEWLFLESVLKKKLKAVPLWVLKKKSLSSYWIIAAWPMFGVCMLGIWFTTTELVTVTRPHCGPCVIIVKKDFRTWKMDLTIIWLKRLHILIHGVWRG